MPDSAPTIFDFDEIGVWGPRLSEHLLPLLRADYRDVLQNAHPKYIEDAADILFTEVCPDKAALVVAVTGWIKAQTVKAFHGSRLTHADVEDIRQRGLLALIAGDRKAHLSRKLDSHPDWAALRDRLDAVLHKMGTGNAAGQREGQVHATLSRIGLLRGFNHYLTHGSEFDQHAAHMLVGDDSKPLLANHGRPTLITLAIPGTLAFEAANPYLILVRDMPNIVREVINVWAYWIAHPDFSLRNERYDCGLAFGDDIPAGWISSIETIDLGTEN